MERRFACTACGKCCYGWVPLTHAGRFPLAVVWTPVRQVSKAFAITAKLGLTVKARDKKTLAVRIAPTAYIPPSMPCPALLADNLCGIHSEKPSRCRTMPFFPYREESDQSDLLVPRAGWICDVSQAAPVVYRNKVVVNRADFECEYNDLVEQAPALRTYGEGVLAMVPGMIDNLSRASLKPGGGHVALSFASFLRRLTDLDKGAVARTQLAVLGDFAAKVAGQPTLAEYHRNYGNWAWEMERLAG